MTTATVAELPAPRHAGVLTSTALVTKRALVPFLRSPAMIIFSPMQMIGFLLLFRYVFGGAIESGKGLGYGHGLSYIDFGAPGFIAAGVLFTMVTSATAMAEDMQKGFIDRMRSLPMPRHTVLVGRILADLVLLVWSLGVTTAVAFAIGYRLTGTWLDGLTAFALCLLFGFGLAWVFISLGLLIRDARTVQFMMMPIFVLTFASSAYVPTNTMPGWLRAFADHQPVTQMVESVRALTLGDQATALLGHSAGYFIVRALIWTAGIFVVSFPLAVRLFERD
ncbi:ABC transporter permease [Spirillospora sp. NPDC049652]